MELEPLDGFTLEHLFSPAPPGELAVPPQDGVERLPAGGSVRSQIEALEDRMLELPQVECPVEHHFAPGLYARQIVIPAGTMLTGKIHKEDDINVLLSGEIDVMTPAGFKRMKGPCTFVAKAGTKKLGYAHTDVVWTTIHHNPTDEQDIDRLEALLVHNEREVQAILENEAREKLT